jgi:hypothetical protein
MVEHGGRDSSTTERHNEVKDNEHTEKGQEVLHHLFFRQGVGRGAQLKKNELDELKKNELDQLKKNEIDQLKKKKFEFSVFVF